MLDAPTDPLDLRRLFSSIGVEQFFSHYWQRGTLTLPIDDDVFAFIAGEVGPLDIIRLAGLAREGTQAWIANEYVAHSVVPVDASNAEKYFSIGATLYFVNVPIERLTNKLADFLGAPRRKVIASLFLTPPTGGASAHFDRNENFTIQLTGVKKWIVGDVPKVAAPPDGYVLGQQVPGSLVNLMANKRDEQNHSVELRPGTLLYLPRGTVHRTETGEVSWSLNLSYSPAMWLDLLRIGLQQRLINKERWRGTVAGLGNACDPVARRENILPELIADLREMLANSDELDQLCREFFDNPDRC